MTPGHAARGSFDIFCMIFLQSLFFEFLTVTVLVNIYSSYVTLCFLSALFLVSSLIGTLASPTGDSDASRTLSTSRLSHAVITHASIAGRSTV